MSKTCLRCGSAKIMTGIPLDDHWGEWGTFKSPAQVQIHGQPQRWNKDSAVGKVSAEVCGDCGYAELTVSNFKELYEKYLKAGGDT